MVAGSGARGNALRRGLLGAERVALGRVCKGGHNRRGAIGLME